MSKQTTKLSNRIAVSVFFFLAGITFASWASRIPDIKQKLHLNEAALGSLLLVLPLGSMVSLSVSGKIINRIGSRYVLLFAAIAYPLLLNCLHFPSTIFHLSIALFFFGFMGNTYNISVNTQAVGVEKIYGKTIMASFHGIWSLAGFTGASFATLLMAYNIAIEWHFLIILGLASSFLLLFFRNTLPKEVSFPSNKSSWKKPNKTIVELGTIAFCCMCCEGTMFDWSGVYFQKVVNAPASKITLGYTAFMGTMAAGRFVGDAIIEKLGHKKTLIISGLVIALGLLIAVIFPSIFSATLGFLLVGFGVSSVIPLVYSAAGRTNSMAPGSALAAVSSIGFLGFLLGPPVIGYIAQLATLQWSFAAMAVLGLGISILATQIYFK